MIYTDSIEELARALDERVPEKLWHSGMIVSETYPSEAENLRALATLEPDCGVCGNAIGIAAGVFPWLLSDWADEQYDHLVELLNIPRDDADTLFGMGPLDVYSHLRRDVRSQDVAAALRRYIAEGPYWRHDQ